MVKRKESNDSTAAPATELPRRVTRGRVSKKRVANRETQVKKTKNELLNNFSEDHGHDRNVVDTAASFAAALPASPAPEEMLKSPTTASPASATERPPTQTNKNGFEKGMFVAFTLPTGTETYWTLGRIVSNQHADDGTYSVAQGLKGSKVHLIKPEKMRIVPKRPPKWERGTNVLAVYPGTDSFYPATLIERGKLSLLLSFHHELPHVAYKKEVTFGVIFKP